MPGQDFVLGIDFGGTKIDLATAFLSGELHARERAATIAHRGADQALARAIEIGQRLVETTTADGGRCRAVAAVSPGIAGEDGIALAPNIPGWDSLALAPLLGVAFRGIPVLVDNDVMAATLAEATAGALAGADPGLFLSLGTGLGLGIVSGGRVLTGANRAAGEIGYLLRTNTAAGAFAQGRAPLEEAIGGRALGERASMLTGRPSTGQDAMESNDPSVVALVDDALDELACHVANLCITLDPERVAVGGGLTAQADRVIGTLSRRIKEAVPFPPDICLARYPLEGALRGAVTLARQELREHL